MSEEKRDKNRRADSISLMIELTQQGKLEWRNAIEPELPSDEDRMSAVFISEFKDKKLRLYAKRVEVSRIERMSTSALVAGMFGTEPPAWKNITVLEFINNVGETLWAFPNSGALSDLLNAVQYRVAGVNEFLAEIEALAS
jgi:hypothetical protein